MPRAKTDPLKRKCAQALNHQAAAILAVNDVYMQFSEKVEQLTAVAAHSENPMDVQNLERYQAYSADLKTIMMGIAATREHLLLVVGVLWNLDEDSIKVYLG